MEKNKRELWNWTIEEIKNGYTEENDKIKCLICGEYFINGRIYHINSEFYDAKMAVKIHIRDKHISTFDYIINMNSAVTGLSETQKQLIKIFSKNLSDKEISEKMGIATSTIRNHRFKLREKEKQAKLFIAIMDLLKSETDKEINVLVDETLCEPHKNATTLDNRFNVTDKEKVKVLEAYFDENSGLKTFPSKEKKKIVVLEEIMKNFKSEIRYSEKEVNRILKRIYEDFATIRRALIEYGYLDRNRDCSEYWVNE